MLPVLVHPLAGQDRSIPAATSRSLSWCWTIILLLWLGLQLGLARSDSIVGDWNGWRQADTQTIARNFARDRIDPLHPRVAWGGDGTGLVETEVQIYPAVIAYMLQWWGGAEWPGQVISAMAWAAAATGLFFAFQRRFGNVAALLGGAFFLSSPLAVFLSTAVMPEALALAYYTFALICFLEFIGTARIAFLGLSTIMAMTAAFIKPTALNLGIVEFALIVLVAPRLLRSPMLWASWLTILMALALALWHGHMNFHEGGNSFGVISAGTDLKFPRPGDFLNPFVILRTGWLTITWSVGWLGVAALIWIVIRGRLLAEELAIAAGAAAALLISLRYSWDQAHYHVYSTILGAWLVAHATATLRLEERKSPVPMVAATIGLGLAALIYGPVLRDRVAYDPGPEVRNLVRIGMTLKDMAKPGELVIVRSLDDSYDRRWRRRNNYEDPRLLYIADATGWVVPADRPALDEIRSYVGQGARFYVDPAPLISDPDLSRWLRDAGTTLIDDAAGLIVRFDGASGHTLGGTLPEPRVQ